MKNIVILILTVMLITSCDQHDEKKGHKADKEVHKHHDHTEYNRDAHLSHIEDTEIDFDSTSTFPAVGYLKTHVDTILYPIKDVFPLFEPKGRNLLYENWSPVVLHEGQNGTLEGQVLFSKYDDLDVMLTVRKYKPKDGYIQYLVIWDDFEIQKIDIYCESISEGRYTKVKWVEHNAGLYEKGTRLVKMFVTEGYLVKGVQRYFDNVKKTLSRVN